MFDADHFLAESLHVSDLLARLVIPIGRFRGTVDLRLKMSDCGVPCDFIRKLTELGDTAGLSSHARLSRETLVILPGLKSGEYHHCRHFWTSSVS